MMICSADHLSIKTQKWLANNRQDHSQGRAQEFMCSDFHFFASTWYGSEKNWQECPKVPRDLVHVLRYAEANGMDCVMFSHEYPQDPNLPLYPSINNKKPKLPDTLPSTILMKSKISMESWWKKSESIWHVDPNAISHEDLRVSGPSRE